MSNDLSEMKERLLVELPQVGEEKSDGKVMESKSL